MRTKVLPIAVVAAVVIAGGALAWQLSSHGSGDGTPSVTVSAGPGTGSATATTVPTSPAPPTSGASTTSAPATSRASTSTAAVSFRWQPLWPFGSVAAATAWQAKAGSGSQPWRLDAAHTAVAFCTDYLGFTEIDRALSTVVKGEEAWVGVAGPVPEGTPRALAVLHLARIGTGPTATRPWEVVGSDDTRLTLTKPVYGAVVGRNLTVGGLISGVDESLRITVRSLDRGVLGTVQGIAAGGNRTAWSTELTIDDSVTTRATIVVSTGGHLLDVEGFAITGVTVRAAGGSSTTYATPEAVIAPLVANGTYVGDCDHPTRTAPTGTKAVCSSLKGQQANHYLYFVGYTATDVGYFVVLGKQSDRWVVIDNYSATLPPTY